MSDTNKKHSRPLFEETWRERFIKFSKNDDDAGIAGWSASGLEVRFRHFESVWSNNTESTLWLDAGCGAGTYTRFLADRGVRVVGIDYSHPTVIKARDRADDRVLWAVADVTHLPVDSGIFDGVICFGVVQALERSESALYELTRVVKPGGQVWIDALNRWCLPSLWDRMVSLLTGRPIRLRYEGPWRLRRMMKHMGCTNIDIFWVPIFPPSMQRFQKSLETPLARGLLRCVPLVGALFSHAVVLKGRRQ